ncbi:MAG: carboxypeptidase-like regulatory domain-containing protein [Chitinophagaceae bacterium]|jgi:hypothetical protein|nr:carboxypeptidase-like regulatory domain-containing protein [Chitinophagaceae bacterium]
MRVPAILILTLWVFTATAQRTIKGRVVNESTGAAIPGSSVFISNTSKGTVTNSEGKFELNDVPAGKHDLVISCIGYETNVYSFSEQQLPLQVKVQLSIKVKELANVTVEPFLEEGWDKWGKMFMDNFIGSTENGAHCKIKNSNKIKFRYYKKSNRVIAYADEPIIIENKALGYTIKYQLENFEVSFKEHTTFYLGYPLFEDKTKEGKEPKEKWQRRRTEAFKGSVVHFMQSLYNNKLKEEGFEVRRMVRSPNLEKERVKQIYKGPARTIKTSPGGGMVIEIGAPSAGAAGDSSAYYQQVMRQKDHIDVYGADLLTSDSLIVQTEGKYKALYFPNYLYITYKGEFEEEAYLRSIMENRKPGFQRSLVMLLNDEFITVDDQGNYYNPQDFFTSWYWGWSEKISNLLPVDYVPEK